MCVATAADYVSLFGRCDSCVSTRSGSLRFSLGLLLSLGLSLGFSSGILRVVAVIGALVALFVRVCVSTRSCVSCFGNVCVVNRDTHVM